ncbi:MAG: ABC transporter permease [Cryobacterium sp.]|nr:ABC transporter permease [Oligoflexia bacterium]
MTGKRLSIFWFFLLGIWLVVARVDRMHLEHLLEPSHFSLNPLQLTLGTDAFGRNLFHALGVAMQRTLFFASITTVLAVGVGLIAGTGLGMSEGNTRFMGERLLDFALAFPAILLALAIQALVGTGWLTLGFAVSFGLFPSVVRFVSTRAREVAVREYVAAARALGGNHFSIFWRHYRPELFSYLRLKAPSLFAQAILLEATLSFLNLGVSPGVISWGSMLGQAKDYLVEAPHIAWCVGIPLVLTLLSLQTGFDFRKRESVF